jgi:hypothetical protein
MITDVFGREIEVGDVVVRAKFSTFNKHKVVGFTKSSIKLSCKMVNRTRRGYYTEIISVYHYRADSKIEDNLEEHNNYFYYDKNWARLGLIKI